MGAKAEEEARQERAKQEEERLRQQQEELRESVAPQLTEEELLRRVREDRVKREQRMLQQEEEGRVRADADRLQRVLAAVDRREGANFERGSAAETPFSVSGGVGKFPKGSEGLPDFQSLADDEARSHRLRQLETAVQAASRRAGSSKHEAVRAQLAAIRTIQAMQNGRIARWKRQSKQSRTVKSFADSERGKWNESAARERNALLAQAEREHGTGINGNSREEQVRLLVSQLQQEEKQVALGELSRERAFFGFVDEFSARRERGEREQEQKRLARELGAMTAEDAGGAWLRRFPPGPLSLQTYTARVREAEAASSAEPLHSNTTVAFAELATVAGIQGLSKDAKGLCEWASTVEKQCRLRIERAEIERQAAMAKLRAWEEDQINAAIAEERQREVERFRAEREKERAGIRFMKRRRIG